MELLKRYFLQEPTMGKRLYESEKKKKIKKKMEKAKMKKFKNPWKRKIDLIEISSDDESDDDEPVNEIAAAAAARKKNKGEAAFRHTDTHHPDYPWRGIF